jgi:hypothetical protein
VEVLVEGPARRSPGHVAGKTPQFITAVVAGNAAPGTMLRAVVSAATSHTLLAVRSPALSPEHAGTAAAAG